MTDFISGVIAGIALSMSARIVWRMTGHWRSARNARKRAANIRRIAKRAQR